MSKLMYQYTREVMHNMKHRIVRNLLFAQSYPKWHLIQTWLETRQHKAWKIQEWTSARIFVFSQGHRLKELKGRFLWNTYCPISSLESKGRWRRFQNNCLWRRTVGRFLRSVCLWLGHEGWFLVERIMSLPDSCKTAWLKCKHHNRDNSLDPCYNEESDK